MCVSLSVLSDSETAMDCSPPGSSVPGISHARILEWVARGSSRSRDGSLSLQADSLPSEPPGKLIYIHARDCCKL